MGGEGGAANRSNWSHQQCTSARWRICRLYVLSHVDPVNSLIDTVHCPVCMLHFHNRVRVLNHIKYRSPICKLSLTMKGPALSLQETKELDMSIRPFRREQYAHGLRAHSATEPVFRLCGPLPPPVVFTGSYGNMHILGNGRNHYCWYSKSSNCYRALHTWWSV